MSTGSPRTQTACEPPADRAPGCAATRSCPTPPHRHLLIGFQRKLRRDRGAKPAEQRRVRRDVDASRGNEEVKTYIIPDGLRSTGGVQISSAAEFPKECVLALCTSSNETQSAAAP